MNADTMREAMLTAGMWHVHGGLTEADGTLREVAERIVAALPASLDAAWSAAEAALPEGCWIAIEGPMAEESRRYVARALRMAGIVASSIVPWAYGPTPAAALLALADRLREARG